MPSALDAYDQPPHVSLVDGEVVVMGAHVAVSYTAAAALALAAKLIEAAGQAGAPPPAG